MFDTNKTSAQYLADIYKVKIEKCEEEARLRETPIEVAIKEANDASLKKAEEIIKLGILSDEALSEYNYLENAIFDKKKYLKKLYGIDAINLSLQALDEAEADYTHEFITAIEKEDEEYKTTLNLLEEDFIKKKEEIEVRKKEELTGIENEIELLNTSFQQEFEREQAEYEYDIERKRKISKEKREELVSEREHNLKNKETQAIKEKDDCISRIAEIDAMEKDVENIKNVIEQSKASGAEEEERILTKSFQYQKELNESDHKHEVQKLKTRYENLLAKYDKLCQEIQDINTRLDQCNIESRKLTSDTVRSIGGINILNSDRKNRSEV